MTLNHKITEKKQIKETLDTLLLNISSSVNSNCDKFERRNIGHKNRTC